MFKGFTYPTWWLDDLIFYGIIAILAQPRCKTSSFSGRQHHWPKSVAPAWYLGVATKQRSMGVFDSWDIGRYPPDSHRPWQSSSLGGWKMRFPSEWLIFRVYVNFPEGTIWYYVVCLDSTSGAVIPNLETQNRTICHNIPPQLVFNCVYTAIHSFPLEWKTWANYSYVETGYMYIYIYTYVYIYIYYVYYINIYTYTFEKCNLFQYTNI